MSRAYRPPMGARWTALAISGALLATACGSTVSGAGSDQVLAGGPGLSSQPQDGLAIDDGLSEIPAGGAGEVPGTSLAGPSSTLAPQTGTTDAGGAGGGGGGGNAGGTAAGGSTGTPPDARSAPGVTATEVRLGITYFVNGDAAARAAGANITRGDEKKNWQAVVDEVNARGGVAGRRVVPVYYAYDAQSTQTMESQEQEACTAFTQDTRVFAVVQNGTANFTACLHGAGVLHATPGSYLGFDREFYRRYPTYFGQRPSQERLQADLVSALRRQTYFSGWDTARGAPADTKPKVGVIVVDRPEITRTVDSVLLPALSRAGHPVDRNSIYRVPATPSAGEAGPGAAAMQNAVLRFRQEGVTHVIVLDINGATTFLFAQQSSNQAYFPRLGITSASGIQQLYDAKILEARQVNGATGLGWMPALDLPAGQGDRYLSSAAKVCLDVIKRRTGQTFTSTTAAGVAMITCDAVFPLATALQRTGADLTLENAVRAIESVGSGLEAATVPRLFFSPTRHDGLEIGFDMAWDASCPCIRYRDSGHPMP